MSTFKSYFSKNNTIVAKDAVNTGRNPITEISYGKEPIRSCRYTGISDDTCGGRTGHTAHNMGRFSRFIFDLNLDDTLSKVNSGCINLSGGTGTTHTLKMTNTSFFDKALLNDKLVDGTRRASSFTLLLFKISGSSWDEGVGYDYQQHGGTFEPEFDETYGQRPSNWYSATTLTPWVNEGVYTNTNNSTFTVVNSQTFDQGDENISMDMTNEINDRLSGGTPNTGITYGIAYTGVLENLSGLSESYSVGFFTRHTQTFYEPYLETKYDDYISDDRERFYLNKTNRLFLYTNTLGIPTNLDSLPQVTAYDCDDAVFSSMTATNLTCGVYYVEFAVTGSTYGTPSIFTDIWSSLTIGGNQLGNITNEFTLLNADDYYQLGPEDQTPKDYAYSVDGIKMDEKITAGETRKVFVSVRVPYTVSQTVVIDELKYRLYVRQGNTEVETHSWSKVNRTYNHNYFLLNTDDMIPNEYFIDIKATSNQKVNIYKRVTKFQVVNQL
jgi:hypothetical protein|tara:strand:- start:1703 stop:3190 length:1488 start_codon:yes stop_codon:yes gene_type:complete